MLTEEQKKAWQEDLRRREEEGKKEDAALKRFSRAFVIAVISGFLSYWGAKNYYSLIAYPALIVFALSGLYCLWRMIKYFWNGME